MHKKFIPIIILSLVIIKGEVNMDAELANVKVDRLQKMLPKILQEKNIDCWLNFTREGATDPLLPHLGSNHMVARAALIFSFDNDGNYHRIAIAASYDVSPLIDSGIYDEVIAYKQEGVKPHLQRIIREFDPQTIAINRSRDSAIADGLTTGLFDYLEESLPEYKERFMSSEALIISLFSRKMPVEIKALRTAVEITQLIITEAFSSTVIKPGLTTEMDVANYMRKRGEQLGVIESCMNIVVGPMRGHGGPTNRVIQHGDIIRADICFQYNGYNSDIQRTAYILKEGEEEAPDFVNKYWQDCKDANMAALDAIKPGVMAIKSDTAGRTLLVNRGYTEQPFGSGHPIGGKVHDIGPLPAPDWPERYGSLSFFPYEPGMTLAIEPAVIIDDERLGGEVNIGLEEDILVTEEGYEVLGSLQNALWVIK
ncbi:MAG: aminopeptidase P family protein [Candidatus Marinimicrobia bacterium]|nr:aminopeptidase P family protein [Candidatus Neomarinimicrobiota bacterium]